MQEEELSWEPIKDPNQLLNDFEEEAIADFVVGCAQVGFGKSAREV